MTRNLTTHLESELVHCAVLRAVDRPAPQDIRDLVREYRAKVKQAELDSGRPEISPEEHAEVGEKFTAWLWFRATKRKLPGGPTKQAIAEMMAEANASDEYHEWKKRKEEEARRKQNGFGQEGE